MEEDCQQNKPLQQNQEEIQENNMLQTQEQIQNNQNNEQIQQQMIFEQQNIQQKQFQQQDEQQQLQFQQIQQTQQQIQQNKIPISQKLKQSVSSNNLQSFTYYYSSFDLFDELNEFTFIKYRKFVKKLHSYLGGDWQVYANQAIYSMVEDVQQFLTYEDVFELGLQSWLEIRNAFNKQRKASYDEAANIQEEIQYFEENHIYEQFLEQFQKNASQYSIVQITFKPVAQGFFMSAVEIWNETIKSIKNQRVLSENNLFELSQQKENELLQQNKNIQSDNKNKNEKDDGTSQSLVGKLYNSVQKYGQQNQIIKPLIVASETILGYLSQNNKKIKEDTTPQNCQQQNNEIKECQMQNIQPKQNSSEIQNPQQLSQASQKNFTQFRDNLISEEEHVVSKLKELNLMEKQNINRKRKQHEVEVEDDEDIQYGGDSRNQNNVQFENIPQRAEKLNQQVYEYAQNYIQNIKKNTQEKWQVARGFVTNIIELNNNILSKTQKISSDYTSSIKIRFLQPAQQFYNHLMEIWILFRQNSQGQGTDFKKYLEKVKLSMGSKWSENYVLPTQFFFKTLVYTWDSIVQEQQDGDEEAMIKIFIERVRENMHKNWESDIVNKIKHIKDKQDKTIRQQQQQQLQQQQQYQQQQQENDQMQQDSQFTQEFNDKINVDQQNQIIKQENDVDNDGFDNNYKMEIKEENDINQNNDQIIVKNEE